MKVDYEKMYFELLDTVIAAQRAREEGRLGDAWRLLTKGTDKPILPSTAVLSKVGA